MIHRAKTDWPQALLGFSCIAGGTALTAAIAYAYGASDELPSFAGISTMILGAMALVVGYVLIVTAEEKQS